MKKRILLMLALLAYGIRFTALTKPSFCRRPDNERTIHDVIRKHKVAVVYLYHHQLACYAKCSRVRRNGVRQQVMQPHNLQHKGLCQSFMHLSRSGYYPHKAVAFVQINTATEAGKDFIQDNDLSDIRVPSVVLFSAGVVVEDQHGPVILSGALSRQALKKKIDAYINLDIAAYVEQERVCERYEGIMKNRMHVYYSPYFSSVANPWNGYWGWPYYGMAQGNYGGNAGVVMGNGGMSFFGSNY